MGNDVFERGVERVFTVTIRQQRWNTDVPVVTEHAVEQVLSAGFADGSSDYEGIDRIEVEWRISKAY